MDIMKAIMSCSPITSNLVTSIYELESELKGKNELCDYYLCYRFYNRAYGHTKRWPLWNIIYYKKTYEQLSP